MSFATGFLTGLAKSVDEQLKTDMKRTQDRIDGMAQYRVTRRRAELERQDKEKEELRESVLKLASLVGGDTTKAIQMYKAVGNNVSDANKFYDVALKSQRTLGEDFDIYKGVEFASINAPENIKPADYLNNFIDGSVRQLKPLPALDSDVSSGLYGALFKPKIGEQVMRQTDAIAPISKSEYKDTSFIPPAKVNFNEFLDYKKYQKDNQIASKGSFEAQYNEYDTAAFYEKDPEKKKILEKKRDDFYKKYERGKELNKSSTGQTTSLFSKESITSVIQKANIAAIEGAGYTEGVGENLKVLLNGNEGPVFEAKMTALKGLRKRFETTKREDEPILFSALKAEEDAQKFQRDSYIQKQENNYIAATKDKDAGIYEKYQTQDTTKQLFTNLPQAASVEAQFKQELKTIKQTAKNEGYIPGKVIEYVAPNGRLLKLIWTGNSLIQ